MNRQDAQRVYPQRWRVWICVALVQQWGKFPMAEVAKYGPWKAGRREKAQERAGYPETVIVCSSNCILLVSGKCNKQAWSHR